MAFTPRTFEQILNDMIAYVQSRTSVSDFNVGSVIRTILEAAALEDDEQYFQMVQLLDLYSFTTAAGEDLDRRLGDFGITRRSAVAATAKGRFVDNNLIKTRSATDVSSGGGTITGLDTSRFPTSGYPYTIRIGEGTPRLQNIQVTNNNTSTMELTVSSLPFDVFVGDRIAFVTGGSMTAPTAPSSQSRTITIGAQVQAPPTVTELARLYTTTEPAFILQGNYESNEVIIKCTTSGSAGNVGSGRINQFPSSPPFTGAAFSNSSPASGGLDRETDSEFRTRALEQLQSLSRGTPLALKSGAIGITDPVTQNRVISSNIVEDFTAAEVFLYVDDGTGAIARTAAFPADSVSPVLLGAMSLTPTSATDWPNSGYVLIETDGVNPAELVPYSAKIGTTLALSAATTSPHAGGSLINFVDVVSTSAEATQRRFRLTNFPVVRNSERIFIKLPSDVWTLLARDVDYKINRGTGEVQLTDVGGVPAGTQMVAHYTYYTNLIAEVQKVMEGDVDDPVEFPGIKAAGIFLSVEQPIIKRITVVASITADSGYTESDLAAPVQRAIEGYISSRRIGQDVIVSKIIDAAFAVTGLADIDIRTPSSNVIVLESELPIPFDASGNSLVQVT